MTKTHGQSGTKLHFVWIEMRQRCRNKNSKKYKHYGGRGIEVCAEWQQFENFFEWAQSNGYEEGLSLDRVDVNGNYEPANCRWVTQLVQTNNTRKTIMIYYKGREQSIADWARELGLNYYTLRSRARLGWTPKAMFETPMEGKMFGRDKNIC